MPEEPSGVCNCVVGQIGTPAMKIKFRGKS